LGFGHALVMTLLLATVRALHPSHPAHPGTVAHGAGARPVQILAQLCLCLMTLLVEMDVFFEAVLCGFHRKFPK